jgi:hypothetical protein
MMLKGTLHKQMIQAAGCSAFCHALFSCFNVRLSYTTADQKVSTQTIFCANVWVDTINATHFLTTTSFFSFQKHNAGRYQQGRCCCLANKCQAVMLPLSPPAPFDPGVGQNALF